MNDIEHVTDANSDDIDVVLVLDEQQCGQVSGGSVKPGHDIVTPDSVHGPHN